MSNANKNATLGMPHGTASNRLRRLILFDLLQRHRENICVRCGTTINSVEELSIEHILPWEGISAERFWDLKNVAFSHLMCNRASQRPRSKGPTIHGTPNAWRYHGCRCEECHNAVKQYKSDYRERTGIH